MRKATSMRELSRDDQDIMFDAEEIKMADKIDNFLQTVKEQQESLAKMLEQRRMRRPSGMSSTKQTVASNTNMTRKRSNTSSLNNTKAKVNSWISRPPNKSLESKRKPATQSSFKMNNGMRPVPAFSVEDVTSKLKGDRNYQPPRRKRVQRPMQPQSRSLTRQETIKSTTEYNDDFEEEEDVDCQERDEEDMITKKKEAWLFDQAIRGRARQKAAQAMKMNKKINGYQEKESSKDSAYGFSGGENSRLHTREPTPDTNILAPKIMTPSRRTSASRHQHNAASKRKQFLNSLKGPSTPPGRKYVSKSPNGNVVSNKSPIRHIVDQAETDKVEFLNRVTKEILARGNFTEKAIKRALESQLSSDGRVIQRVTLTEKTALVNKLKADLGIERPSGTARQRSSNSESSSTASPKDSKRQKEGHGNEKDDLSLLLASESDADLVEIIKGSVRKCTKPRIQGSILLPQSDKSPLKEDKRKVSQMSHSNQLDSLNLTNLNVSFNSCNMAEAKRR